MAKLSENKPIEFTSEEQAVILREYSQKAYLCHVGCHELLGHGVGKTIFRNEDGSSHKFIDPLTEEEFESCYEKDDTWSTRFGAISSSYEECRADACGLYLSILPEVYSLFDFKDEEVSKLLWTSSMNHFRKGILGLTLYNPESKKWGQAHTQGAFVFAMWVYKNQKSKVVDFELLDNNTDFRINLSE